MKFEKPYRGFNGWEVTLFGYTFFCWHREGMEKIGIEKNWRERFSIHRAA